VTLNHQPADRRYVLHLLYANTMARGAGGDHSAEGFVRDSMPVEVIEDLTPLRGVEARLRVPESPVACLLQPQGQEIPFEVHDSRVVVKVDELTCHQMVTVQY